MAAPAVDSPARARGASAGLFAALVAALLLLAAVPLVLSPPVGLVLHGSSMVPAGEPVEFSGRFTLASFGLGGAGVDVYLDGAWLQRVTTADDGSFVVKVDVAEPGVHALWAIAASGAYTEASTREMTFRAVLAPAAPLRASAQATSEGVRVEWSAPPVDEHRPVQAYRVYRQPPGAPWEEVATVPGDRSLHVATGSGADRYAVAAANVAGESPWALAR